MALANLKLKWLILLICLWIAAPIMMAVSMHWAVTSEFYLVVRIIIATITFFATVIISAISFSLLMEASVIRHNIFVDLFAISYYDTVNASSLIKRMTRNPFNAIIITGEDHRQVISFLYTKKISSRGIYFRTNQMKAEFLLSVS